ncbi:MAG: HEAT repeat domain-containing protein [Polyangiaceae bacterium]
MHHQPSIEPSRASAPDPKKIPAVYAAKWPPDDSDLPGGAPGGMPGSPGGYGGGGYGDDGNFKKGAIKPAYVIAGLAMVVGAVGLGIFAIQGESNKMKVEDVARERKLLYVLPKAEQMPKWREWAQKSEVPALQQEAFEQLAWAKDPEGLPLIIKGLSSTDARVVGTAAAAIFEYGSPTADGAKAALLEALKKADASNKPQICWALALLKEPTAFEEVLKEYREGHLAKVQRLDGFPVFDPDVLAAMVPIEKLAQYAGDPSDSLRQLVAVVLSRNGDPKWTEALTKLVQDKVEIAREAAVGLGKIANEQSLKPLLSALEKADKDNRAKFLEALRDGIGAQGLVLALKSVSKTTPEREKFQTKQIFEMIKDLADPRGGDLLYAYINSNPKPHWKTEAAIRMAEIGDIRAAQTLGWRLGQDTLKLYNDAEDPELRRDDAERVVGSRMLADLAILYPAKKAELRAAAEDTALFWATDYPQPHANALRFLAAVESPMPRSAAGQDPTSLPEEASSRRSRGVGDGAERAPLPRLGQRERAGLGHPREAAHEEARQDGDHHGGHDAGRPRDARHGAPRHRRRREPWLRAVGRLQGLPGHGEVHRGRREQRAGAHGSVLLAVLGRERRPDEGSRHQGEDAQGHRPEEPVPARLLSGDARAPPGAGRDGHARRAPHAGDPGRGASPRGACDGLRRHEPRAPEAAPRQDEGRVHPRRRRARARDRRHARHGRPGSCTIQ